jgi:ABC-type antimicrobial peptide transport system permease subunit
MLEIGRSAVLATMLGLGVGLAASFLVLRAMKGFIYGIGMYDPATLIGTALVLAIVAVAATFLPARRISRIDPTTILREE